MGLITPLVVHQSPIKSSSFGLIMSSWLDTPMRPPDQIRLGALSTALNALISVRTIITRGMIRFRSWFSQMQQQCFTSVHLSWGAGETRAGGGKQGGLVRGFGIVVIPSVQRGRGHQPPLVDILQWRRRRADERRVVVHSSRAERASCCNARRFFTICMASSILRQVGITFQINGCYN